MNRQSPPRKFRRGEWYGDDTSRRRSGSKWDKGGLPPPPDVVGSCGHGSQRLDSSYQDYRRVDDEHIFNGEGRGRFDRAEPSRMRHRRSPDRYERREEHQDSFDDDAWEFRGREQPTDTIILKGSVESKTYVWWYEEEGGMGVPWRLLYEFFLQHPLPGLTPEFHSVEHCVTAEERWLRDRLDEERLYRVSCEFAQPSGSIRVSDWLCNVCKTLNFSRRDECIKCRSDRDWHGDSPTRTICVSNIDPEFTEDDLKILVAEHGVAQDVRLVRSRTGSCSQDGIAYITFATTQDATAAKEAITGAKPAGQGCPLEATFAQDRGAQKASMASQAVAAAAAMNAYNSSRREDISSARPDEHGGWKPREVPAEDTSAAATDMPAAHAAAPGFVYDEASGYYHDAGTGYYYDAKTQLYYHPTTQSWYRHNEETGEYDSIPADGAAPASERSESTGADTAKHSDRGAAAHVIHGRPELDVQGTHAAGVKSASPTGSISQNPAETVSKTSGKSDMVSVWLQRKAEEQRKAARDFLKKPEDKLAARASTICDKTENPAPTATTGEQTGQSPSPADGVDTIVKHLAGGIVRGKVYSKKAL